MSFSISFDKEVVKYLESLPTNISERIIDKSKILFVHAL